MLWEVDIYPSEGQPDLAARAVAADAADLQLADQLAVTAAHSYLIQGRGLDREQVTRLVEALLADGVVERTVVAPIGDDALNEPPEGRSRVVHVLPKPGVTDPVAESAAAAMADLGIEVEQVRTMHKYWLDDLPDEQVERLASRILANDAIEEVVIGPLPFDRIKVGSTYDFELVTVPIRELDDDGLMRLSREGQLYLKIVEMQTIKAHFCELDRDPTDVELETIAQTWSEHCSHKTLAGRIAYRDENGERRFENMLKETIFAATQEIRKRLGDDDWCVSVFEDNAGIVRFDEANNVAFKVETHNHPSALEPYGGANTGIGGVIRDTLGTGMGAKPICNTDIFCFAPPDASTESLPPGVLHPRLVMKGVVTGVRDYGNRMGIPTVNGALYFDERYLGNPLVYCGNVGLIPREMSFKQVQPGDLIVAVGGRTGRDGIHGATFSSAELTSESESLSGGAVQIGNAITEKMVADVVLAARDLGLFTAITDCGAGGFSSAVGEMGEKVGAEVWLDKAPLKYEGLSYTEIWISEAQERMVLSVPESKWEELESLCRSEGVEATVIGKFVPTGRLELKYHDRTVGDLLMAFMHDGRPPTVREAVCEPAAVRAVDLPKSENYTDTLLKILGSLNVASKEWVIRQYDHEVQGGSAIKPLVGVAEDGPGDAAVVRPVLDSMRGLAISCGMNPHYGDFDTYHMAASAIDEAVRNCVAVGADPSRIAILDNFCWGDCDRSETLGSLVRAALACYDVALALGTPFISGKDSLNNEFSYTDEAGKQHTIIIPPTLLISAMGQVDDVRKCVTMDLKKSGNLLYLVGETKEELGGSHYTLVHGLDGGQVPTVDPEISLRTFAAMHNAIQTGLVRSCHDLSEGGLAVAAAEMAFAGGLGATIELDESLAPVVQLFSESNTRFLCEVNADCAEQFETALSGIPCRRVGEVTSDATFVARVDSRDAIQSSIAALKEAWQAPLRW
jgi:phosphoribosylformylglycinamidine synthase